MKNFIRKILFLLLVCGGIAGAAAQDTPPVPSDSKPLLNGSLSFYTCMLFGGMNEYVYEKGESHELSRLEWEEYFIPFLNLRGEFSVWNFFIEGAVLSAIPRKGGNMRDYDFLIMDTVEPSHFSQHDAMLDKHFELNAALGYKFEFKRWYIAPAAGIFYRQRKWSAQDGYSQYPSDGSVWTPDMPKHEMAGTIITFAETTWMPQILLHSGFRFNDIFEVNLTLSYYPYTNVSTVDTHILRSPPTRYIDFQSGAKIFALAGEGSLVFRPRSLNGLGWIISAGWQGVFPGRGRTESCTVGYNTEVEVDEASQSRTESSMFWGGIGVILYPRNLRK